ncbi:sensor histidine kinase [Verrucomicrobium spinosum]|uniref:sensor histidine kinase n=1 Tax=Verrucomicrobium spinosum TaxID=2736 RepID=UPI000309991A|nr:histidine kinase [Verrucomicrobium spinosum]
MRRLHEDISLLETRLATLAHLPEEQTGERLGYHSRILQGGRVGDLWVQVDLGASREFDTVVLVPVVLPRELGGIAGYGFPRRFRVAVAETPDMADEQVLIDSSTDLPNPGRAPLLIHAKDARGQHLRVTATGPTGRVGSDGRINWPSLALAEVMVLHGDRNLAAGRRVTAPTSREAAPVWSLQNLTDGESVLAAPVGAGSKMRKGWHSEAYPEATTPVSITLDLGQVMPLDDVRLFPMRWEGYPHWLGFGFPVRYKVECADDPSFSTSRTVADFTRHDVPNPGMNAVTLPADGFQARMIRITATQQWERFTDHAFALSEVQVYSAGANVARQATVTTTSVYPSTPWANENLVDGDASDNPILPLQQWVQELQESSRMEHELKSLKDQQSLREAKWKRGLLRGGIGLVLLTLAVLSTSLVRNSLRRRRELRSLQQRIARDLHDEVGSNLAGISLLSREASQTASPPLRRQILEEVCRVADETAASMRDLVWMVQPGMPGDLVSGLRLTAGRMLSGMSVQFHPPETALPPRLELEFKRELFLIFKETLQNIARHSGAKSVVISFTREGRLLVVRIKDDGKGLPKAGENPTPGNGLENMRQRARSLRGEVRLISPEDGGCEVQIRVPWPV